MIWALLAFLGVPLWLCAAGILTLVLRNRRLRMRHGDIPVRVLRPGRTRWTRGHAVWVSDVLAWRGFPAAWDEDLVPVVGARGRSASPEERTALHGLGEDPAVVDLRSQDGTDLVVAASSKHRASLLGPFADADRQV
jgi:hypothetical protein